VTPVAADDADALPEPPSDLARRVLPAVRRGAGKRYVRIHRMTDGPIWFGWDGATATFRTATNRFDAPDRSYGVLYLAATRDGASRNRLGESREAFGRMTNWRRCA
jgi:hypothetical protein